MAERKAVKGIVLPLSGPSTEGEFTDFRSYQAVVEGLIEAVVLKDGSTMYVNEEGMINGMDVNWFATDVAGLGGRPDLMFVGVRGPVVIVGPVDDEGYVGDVTEKARGWIRRVEKERSG